MDIRKYNARRYQRRKMQCHFILGLQQFTNHKILNVIWILFLIFIACLVLFINTIFSNLEVYTSFLTILRVCKNLIIIIISIEFLLIVIYFVGTIFARKDEADMEIIFNTENNKKNQPILAYKRRNKKTGIVKREFYTCIPMQKWEKSREEICDRMNINIIGNFSYGGKNRNKGYFICFESLNGRNKIDRGFLYDTI